MAKIPSYLKRASAILKMPDAIARGLTPTAYLRELQSEGVGYRKQRLFADWRNVAGFEARKDTYKYIRRDRLPSQKFVVDVDWEISKKYMIKFAITTEKIEREGLEPMHINIMTDILRPVPEIQAEVYNRWGITDSVPKEPITKIQLIGIWHRVPSLEMPTPSPFIIE